MIGLNRVRKSCKIFSESLTDLTLKVDKDFLYDDTKVLSEKIISKNEDTSFKDENTSRLIWENKIKFNENSPYEFNIYSVLDQKDMITLGLTYDYDSKSTSNWLKTYHKKCSSTLD